LLVLALSGLLHGGLTALCGCERAAIPSQPSIAAPVASSTPAAPAVSAAPVASAAAADPPTAQSRTLLRLAQDWARDPELSLSSERPVDDLARCPRAQHELRPENAASVPPTFVPFERIATHACDAVLRVFLGCRQATDDGTSCLSWRERLVLEPVGTGAPQLVGDIDPVVGGNSGGLFVPFAFDHSDHWILLRAWMFSPGAGGGAVDYGVGVVARSTRQGESTLEVRPFPVRSPSFYADYGCAIGLGASDQTPTYSQPGFPSNNGGALVAVDLATLQPHTLLEERDTTYAVGRIDEKAGTLGVEVARHTFGKDCPREEGALGCSAATTGWRTITLPPCGPAGSRPAAPR
jgi:hypothetical protein